MTTTIGGIASTAQASGVESPADEARARVEPPATSLLDAFKRRPGWPVVLLFLGYPLWWALGVTEIVAIIAVGAMLVELMRMRTVRVPPGFGWWLLFLAWVLIGVALVQVNVPGAVPGASGTRYFTWAWRLFWYLKATILLLYIGNQRHRLSLSWVCRIFAWMFVFIVAGGLLGAVAPTFQFHSLLELALPHRVSSIAFVHANIHPIAAESFVNLGVPKGRLSAPFPYANVWGLNFVCFLPFFVVAWLGRDAGWRRFAAPLVLGVAFVTVVLSLNRGMWLALIVAMVFVAMSLALAGRTRVLVTLIVGAAVIGAIVAASPLGKTIDTRLHGTQQNSNEGRANLSALGTSSMAKASPLLGFGTTRNVQGNFDSIAGGQTSDCPRCVVPPLGTQGQYSLVAFTQGIGGLILYFGFLILQFLRHIRMRSEYALAGLSVLLVHLVTATVYGADNLSILAIFGALALLWRSRIDEPTSRSVTRERTVHDYLEMVVEHGRSLMGLLVVGLIGGAIAAQLGGKTYSATASIVVPTDPVYPVLKDLPETLDAIAQFADSGPTLDAMQDAAGDAVRASDLTVTATPNTRILHLTYVAGSSRAGRAVADAAARAVLAQRTADLDYRHAQAAAALEAQASALEKAIETAVKALNVTHSADRSRPLITQLTTEARKVDSELATVNQLPLDAGSLTGPVVSRVIWDRWKVKIADGLAIGFLLWVGLAVLAGSLSPRLRKRRFTTASRGLRVAAEGPADLIDEKALLALERPSAFVCVSGRRHAVTAAAALDASIEAADRLAVPTRVVLVAARQDRVREAVRARRSLSLSGVHVSGVLIVDPPQSSNRTARS
jgi:hypothetical protein